MYNYLRSSYSRYFDYLQGRRLKIDLPENEHRSHKIDSGNCKGTIAEVISKIRNHIDILFTPTIPTSLLAIHYGSTNGTRRF